VPVELSAAHIEQRCVAAVARDEERQRVSGMSFQRFSQSPAEHWSRLR
jgi:hypothetical protein